MRIAFIAPLGSGKTTAALHLVEKHGYQRVAFAKSLKSTTLDMLKVFQDELQTKRRLETLEDLEEAKKHPSIRATLQLVGTELGRNFYGPDTIWVDKTLADIGNNSNVVVDDCRFENEYRALKEAGFVIIRIVRPYNDWITQLRKTYTSEQLKTIMGHESEIFLSQCQEDDTFYVATVDEMKSAIDELVKESA